jgi:hypothetical protein
MNTTTQARDIRVGHTFLHPISEVTLRRVEPKNFVGPLGLHVESDHVLAVDDEGGLYAIHPDNHVAPVDGTPLVTVKCDDNYIVVASFERQVSEDLEVMEGNFKSGKIKADPATNFAQAAQEQVALELRDAFADGLAGFMQCHRTLLGRAFDTPKMGWKTDGERATAGT